MTPFEMGYQAGQKGNDVERGLMALGLSFAADAATERNTREWLKGYDAGHSASSLPTKTKQSQWAGWSGRR